MLYTSFGDCMFQRIVLRRHISDGLAQGSHIAENLGPHDSPADAISSGAGCPNISEFPIDLSGAKVVPATTILDMPFVDSNGVYACAHNLLKNPELGPSGHI